MSDKILGMGNALVDVLTVLQSDEILERLNLPKGSMQLIDETMLQQLHKETADYTAHYVAGGSASNTLSILARLGIETEFIGKIGKDEIGNFFQQETKRNGVIPSFFFSQHPSGRCTVLISADGERTMCTYLGASADMTANDLTHDLFDGFRLFHIEGYLVQNYDLIQSAITLAKAAGLTVSLDLSSFNVVEDHLDFLRQIIVDKVDIVFANEDEVKALIGKELPEAIKELASMCSIAVVKTGKKGSIIQHGEDVLQIPIYEAKRIDTTGAGDAYAAGFLYGWINQLPLEMSGQIGSYLAANVIEEIGPKITPDRWERIQQWMNELTHV
jgi:sugar/nucleoside kinase (ribokinase family)